MKQGAGILASLAAVLSSLASMACCLPFGFVAALGAAGAGAFLLKYRIWFLALSVVLLGIGYWQLRRARRCSAKPNVASAVLFWVAVAFVIGMVVFPQAIAGFIADHFYGK
jgi:hypothetical protein